MTTLEQINEVLNCVELTHPVELADVAAIREALGGDVEVFHRVRELVVIRCVEGRSVYQRTLAVKDAPPLRINPNLT